MKRFLLFALCLIPFLAPAREPVTGKPGILPYPITTHQLPNGLNVVTVQYDSPGIAAFYIVVRVGSRDETEQGKTGFAHFFEHMMFRGTERYPKEKYSAELKSIGAAANANTSFDRTVYHMTGDASRLNKMFELEADRFMNLKYSLQDFKTEAGAVKGEYTKNYSDPLRKLYEATLDTAFSAHTYSHTTMGYFEDIVDMPNQYEYSLQFFDRFYRPEYATIIVVGDVQPDDVKKLAEEYFGAWKKGGFQSYVGYEPVQHARRAVHQQVPGFPAQLNLLYKTPAFRDSSRESAALSLLASVIAGDKSELYKKLVMQERKARTFEAGFYFTRDPYLFSVNTSLVKEADLPAVYSEVTSFIAGLASKPVDENYLREIKSRIRYQFAMNMDSPDAIANAISYFSWLTGDPHSLNRYYAILETITPEEIKGAASRYLTESRLTVATLSSVPQQQTQ